MTEEEKKKLLSAIEGILLADHLGDVAREMPKLFALAGIPITKFESFEEAFELAKDYF